MVLKDGICILKIKTCTVAIYGTVMVSDTISLHDYLIDLPSYFKWYMAKKYTKSYLLI